MNRYLSFPTVHTSGIEQRILAIGRVLDIMTIPSSNPITPNPTTKPHFICVDFLRFMAASLVMFYHLLYLSHAREGGIYYLSGGMISFPDATPYTYWGWIGVQIFFVISGFVITFSAYNATAYRFFVNRFVRLMPGIWICASLSYLLYLAFLENNPFDSYLKTLILHPLGPWIDPVYWTIGIEVSFYLIVLLLLMVKQLNSLPWLAIGIGILSSAYSVMHLLAYLLPDIEFLYPSYFKEESRPQQLLLIQHGAYFAIGVLLSYYFMHKNKHFIFWIAAFLVACCVQIIAYNFDENIKVNDTLNPVAPVLVWLTAMAFMIWGGLKWEGKLHSMPFVPLISRRLGLMTYPVYLIHLTFGAFLMGVLARRGFSPQLAVFTAIVFALLASWFISKYLEPPLQKLVKNVLLNRVKLPIRLKISTK